MILLNVKLSFVLVFLSPLLYSGFSKPSAHVSKRENESPINNLQSSPHFTVNDRVLMSLISKILNFIDIRTVVQDVEQGKNSRGACMTCKFGMNLYQHMIDSGKSAEEITDITLSLCINMKIQSERVCRGMIETFKFTLRNNIIRAVKTAGKLEKSYPVFDKKAFEKLCSDDEFITVFSQLEFQPREICGVLLGDSCAKVSNPLNDWNLPLTPLPEPSPAPWQEPDAGKPTLKVVHISDTHVDPLYMAGSDAVCGEPLCCRDMPSQTNQVNEENIAGYWGDYRDCDIPMRTFEEMLKHIKKAHNDIDYVIWTGDIPPHDIWNETRPHHLSLIRSVASLVRQHLGDIPVYPALGNHESIPINSFPPPQITGKHSIAWLYDALADIWSHWLPPHALAQVQKSAYYSTNVRPGLKLISLNTNYCNNQNFWLLLNTTDPAAELEWLINELQAAEMLGEKVHIIGHIPPGSNDCFQIWSRNFNRIINRFENTVVAQFYGHTHQDEFEIFYDSDGDNLINDQPRPTNIAYIAPSVTTFAHVNPGYRVYTVDGDYQNSSYAVIDHATYYLNLTEANLHKQSEALRWYLSYTAKELFSLPTLSPADWHDFVMSMRKEETKFQNFYKIFSNKSDYYARQLACNKDCKNELLCRLVSARSHDESLCKKFFNPMYHYLIPRYFTSLIS